jgi:hypothetical protein
MGKEKHRRKEKRKKKSSYEGKLMYEEASMPICNVPSLLPNWPESWKRK